jgi:hypothetical protein
MLAGIDRNWSRDAPTQPPTSPVLLYNMGHAEEQVTWDVTARLPVEAVHVGCSHELMC